MGEHPSLTESIRNLNRLTGSYVDETTTQIQSILQTLQKLIPPEEYEKLVHQQQEPTRQLSRELAEETLISELDKNRVSLVLDIQNQNATSARLLEMIGEYDELVNALTAYAADFITDDAQDANASESSPLEGNVGSEATAQTNAPKQANLPRDSELSGIEQALDANLVRIEKELKQLQNSSLKQLTSTQEAWLDNGSIENEKKLLELISTLNLTMKEETKS